MKVTPVIMDDFLLVILTSLLINRSIQMDIHKVHNLPSLHQDPGAQFPYLLEGQYLAVFKHGLHPMIPTEHDITV